MTSNNMYRVGDFVYFEVSAAAPYQIRKIEELNKTSTGAVEAKVVCFYRRRDLSLNLIQLADKHQKDLSHPSAGTKPELLHQIRHREIFLSRHLETLPATHIRGKCTVTLHSDTEPCDVYLAKEDSFFFQLVYDPLQKTLQADRGTIREGPDYQAEVPAYVPPDPAAEQSAESREELRWRPDSGLSAAELDSFLLLSRSLGTLGRAYHAPSTLRQPNLTMSAAAAARDATHQLALDTLHAAGYDVGRALQLLAPNNQPMVKLDEMEQWSASEGNLFEEALCKYGKCFYDIQSDFLPWKHPKSLIEFYYMWKTTDHYIQQKRIKAAEAEHHLKQVYIPNYNKPNPSVLYPNPDSPNAPVGCEGCTSTSSPQWYALGPATSPLKVCAECWAYWKRYGDLKAASILDKVTDPTATNLSVGDRSTSKPDLIKPLAPKTLVPPRPGPGPREAVVAQAINAVAEDLASRRSLSHKSRGSINFHFLAPVPLRLARRLRPVCKPARRQGRRPFKRLASLTALYADTTPLLAKLTATRARQLLKLIAHRPIDQAAAKLRTDALHLLLTRLFPNRIPPCQPTTNNLCRSETGGGCTVPSASAAATPTEQQTPSGHGAKSTSPDSSAQSAAHISLNGLPTADSSTVATQKRPAPVDDDVPTNSPEPHPAKRVLISEKPSGQQQITVVSAAAVPTGTLSMIVGPQRRIGMGIEENGAVTLMYRATDTIKRCRRKLLSVAELRRFGRHPWSERLPNPHHHPSSTPNGTNPSAGDRVNGSVGSESSREPSVLMRTNSSNPNTNAVAAGSPARVHKDLSDGLAVSPSPSAANQSVVP